MVNVRPAFQLLAVLLVGGITNRLGLIDDSELGLYFIVASVIGIIHTSYLIIKERQW